MNTDIFIKSFCKNLRNVNKRGIKNFCNFKEKF